MVTCVFRSRSALVGDNSPLFICEYHYPRLTTPFGEVWFDVPETQLIFSQNRTRAFVAVSHQKIKIDSEMRRFAANVEDENGLDDWVSNQPGVWTAFLFGPDFVLIRTNLMRSSEIFYKRENREHLVISDSLENFSRKESSVAKKLAAYLLLYPAPPIYRDTDDLTESAERLPEGAVVKIDSRLGISVILKPELSSKARTFSEGVEKLRHELFRSIASTDGTQLGADLSGGFDSTSICYFLRHLQRQFIAFTGASRSAQSRDWKWASAVAGELGIVEHQFWDPAEIPLPFTFDSYSPTTIFPGLPNVSKIRFAAQKAAQAGVDVLIGGHGGDELFDLDSSFLAHSFWARPWKTSWLAKEYSSLERWSRGDFLSLINPLASWSKQVDLMAKGAFGAPRALGHHPNRWALTPWFIPPWMNKDYIDILSIEVPTLLKENPLLGGWELMHHRSVSNSASGTQHICSIYQEEGVSLRTPYLDENVFRAVVSLQPELIGSPMPPKQGLRLAFDGIVNPRIYQRTDQDSGAPDVFSGWTENRAEISAELSSSWLVREGIVDHDTVREFASRQIGKQIQPIALSRTLAVSRAGQRISE